MKTIVSNNIIKELILKLVINVMFAGAIIELI